MGSTLPTSSVSTLFVCLTGATTLELKRGLFRLVGLAVTASDPSIAAEIRSDTALPITAHWDSVQPEWPHCPKPHSWRCSVSTDCSVADAWQWLSLFLSRAPPRATRVAWATFKPALR